MYGKTLSDEAKKKISENNKVRIQTTIVSVTIDNIAYNSLTDASKTLNIPISTILWRVKSSTSKFNNYNYTDKTLIKKSLSTKISINNIEYNSILEACEKLNFCKEYVTNKLRSDLEEDKEWKILDKPRDKRLKIGRKVEIKGIIYNSIKEASEKLQIHEAGLAKILNSKKEIPVSPKKKVSINDIIYESVSEASQRLQTNINVIIKRLKSENPKFKDYFYLPIEYIDLSNYKYL